MLPIKHTEHPLSEEVGCVGRILGGEAAASNAQHGARSAGGIATSLPEVLHVCFDLLCITCTYRRFTLLALH